MEKSTDLYSSPFDMFFNSHKSGRKISKDRHERVIDAGFFAFQNEDYERAGRCWGIAQRISEKRLAAGKELVMFPPNASNPFCSVMGVPLNVIDDFWDKPSSLDSIPS